LSGSAGWHIGQRLDNPRRPLDADNVGPRGFAQAEVGGEAVRQEGKQARGAASPGEVPAPVGGGFDDTGRTATLDRIPDPAGSFLTALWDEEWEQHLFAVAKERLRHQVSDAHYQIFDLYVVQHWPAREVARTLGVNVTLVYLVKHRISRLLKNEVKRLEAQLR
jgi:DNA-directed RNA polymerase specialized sigma24 family protein